MSQNLQNLAKFQKCHLDNLVDFEKCCKTHVYLQKSVPIQPKTSNILPKFCRTQATVAEMIRLEMERDLGEAAPVVDHLRGAAAGGRRVRHLS